MRRSKGLDIHACTSCPRRQKGFEAYGQVIRQSTLLVWSAYAVLQKDKRRKSLFLGDLGFKHYTLPGTPLGHGGEARRI